MTFMKKGEVIAQAKRNQILFTLDLALLSQAMSVKAKAIIAVKKQGWPTQLVNQNKCVRIWHQKLAHISKAWVVRALTLVDGIDLGAINKEYNSTKVWIDFDNFKASDSKPTDLTTNAPQILESLITAQAIAARQASDVLDKICTLYIGNKSTRIVRR